MATLPAGAADLRFAFVYVAAFAFRVDPQAGEAIFYSKGAMANGEYMELGSTAGRFEVAWDGTNWVATLEQGTLDEETP